MALNYGQGTIDRPSQGWKLFITATVMVIVAGFFVLGRLVVRYKSKLFGWDDYTIAFSLVSPLRCPRSSCVTMYRSLIMYVQSFARSS